MESGERRGVESEGRGRRVRERDRGGERLETGERGEIRGSRVNGVEKGGV